MERDRTGGGDAGGPSNRGNPSKFITELLHHDLSNHLFVIRHNAVFLEDEISDSGSGPLESIKSQTDAAIALLEEAKAFTNGTRGESLEIEDVSTAIEIEIGHVEEAYPDANLIVDASGDVTARTSPLFGSIVGNLLRNAIEHSDQGEPTVRVTVEVNQRTIDLKVEDDGPGIPQETLDEVRNDALRAEEGHGLYIVSSLVEEYGGTMTIDTDSSGTTVAVKLPVVTEEGDLTADGRSQDISEADTLRHPIKPDESVSVAVVRATGAVTDTQVEDLDPIGTAIDPDALDALFQDHDAIRVEFRYHGHKLTVVPDQIRIETNPTDG